MGLPIRAKILNIVGHQTFVMNFGKNKGVTKNMRFEVSASESGGSARTYVKCKVKVVEVYEKFSLIESYETAQKVSGKEDSSKINVGDDLLQIT
jgi:hypothetical protein